MKLYTDNKYLKMFDKKKLICLVKFIYLILALKTKITKFKNMYLYRCGKNVLYFH